jgi:hypothetical protein
MSQLTIDTIDKIVIARDYHVSEWLIPTLNDLARREQPIRLQDANRLGWDYALRIAEVRESFSSGPNASGDYCRYCENYMPSSQAVCSRENYDFTTVIGRVFARDLVAA